MNFRTLVSSILMSSNDNPAEARARPGFVGAVDNPRAECWGLIEDPPKTKVEDEFSA